MHKPIKCIESQQRRLAECKTILCKRVSAASSLLDKLDGVEHPGLRRATLQVVSQLSSWIERQDMRNTEIREKIFELKEAIIEQPKWHECIEELERQELRPGL